MPVRDYGVWKALPVHYEFEDRYEDPESPHLSLYYHDNKANPPQFDPGYRRNHRGGPRDPNRPSEIPGLFRAAINIKSRDEETRLAYFVRHDFVNHPIAEKLAKLDFGFHPMRKVDELDGKGLDYIRGALFTSQKGRVLPHDIPGVNNDLIDVLEPEVKKAIQAQATIFVFGSMFKTRNGIHNVHMNQGNILNFRNDDGVFQDGGLLIRYDDHWTGVLLAFASQAVHTDDNDGHALEPLVTWTDVLPVDRVENSVTITEALVNPQGADDRAARTKESITLGNLTSHEVSLESWSFHNSAGQTQDLPRNAVLAPWAMRKFEVPNCPLSNSGDTITLLNEKGLRVDGVSYGRRQGQQEGRPIVFAH
ncbi:O-methyltransferase [Aspergillus brunneoviolaceus CBS 621.78]|uniref:O-methyltransferase n=1 Tax=Aspergillus brunneoviolaceus CBS 621.78 TaxID=1450534 RepID=A0ACD1GAF9_9EURO|nr:O-methyltransferase [Aspergillus brunneoviolaceus CBS 621.78]RAH46195.1 O-methyltransferase [Aspergillus brunneoviolaceus CBS 621.78]